MLLFALHFVTVRKLACNKQYAYFNELYWMVSWSRLFGTNYELLESLCIVWRCRNIFFQGKSTFIVCPIKLFRQLDVIRLRHTAKQPVMETLGSLNSWSLVFFLCSKWVRFLETRPNSKKGYRMIFASMRALRLFLRARAVVTFVLRAASTQTNTDGK